MKKILFLSVFLLGLCNVTAQNYYMTAPEGYGKDATGGGSAATTTVTTYAGFKAAIKLVPARIILVSGTITFGAVDTQISEKVVNKTIIGLPGAKLVNTKQTETGSGILNLKAGSNNVIIRNLVFEGPGAWDHSGRDNLCIDGGTNIWVDHCEFQDAMDGNFDIKGLADNITVSWCKFIYNKAPKLTDYETGGTPDHRFTNLIGSDKDDKPADGNFSVTFKNCYWAEGCKERMPRARNAQLHMLNCYYNTSISTAVAIGLGGGINNAVTSCYIENSDFAKVKTVYKAYTGSGDDGGTVKLTYDGSVKGIPSTSITNSGTATKPTYTYTVLPVANVATYVPNATCGAGATLQVTAAGVMSTSCPNNLGTDDYAAENGVKLYPTLVNSTLNIDLSDAISGEAAINIFSITGEKVYSTSKNVSSDEKVSIDVANLSQGLYLFNITIGKTSTTLKFIKE
ncbi:MAG: T9SS type A sorting domain-containing protein [Bacteroidota bacterium]